MAKSVLPPLIQCRMWWAWVHAGGRLQPGKAHPWSRAINARRWCAETRRWLRPSFSGTPSPSMRMAVSSQSHAMRRALAAEIGPIQGIHPGATGSAPNMAR